MGGWGEYAAAWTVFLLSHAIPVRPPVKPWLVARLGAAGFGIAYSVLSLAILIWLIGAAQRAPFVELWPRAGWQNHVTLAAMILACLVLALALARPNPFSFGGAHDDRFDPDNPGIVGLTRHPVLAALALWALGHLVPNGDLAHVLMFGGFACFALLGMRLIDRRRQGTMGRDTWRALLPRRGLAGPFSLRRGLAGLLLAGLLVALHPFVIGVPAVW
ncbi:NnrU family protein [Sedimentitalea sp. JM2-8]|uniref:NnrU family protein n=1 Tax=Sedimentitalea xiamensis TaxID=3050037 RepID=A0ABT7FHW9_9RHOB|nr:NnrU family protein [Sedimentitalea xiamensis]MDK3074585.1 NnrU family protein [Sedimentitalea xiamensis]